MRIGVIGMPTRNSYNGQGFKTRFFILGIPLFPTSCIYKISDNLGIEVPMTGKDVLHAYAKIHFGLLGFGGLIWSANMYGNDAVSKTIVVILSLCLLGFCIYSWVFHSEAQGDELENRKIFGKAFLYNMPPEYLPLNVQKSLFGELLKTYLGKFGNLDWEEKIKNNEMDKSNFSILYTMAYYQKTIQSSSENNVLFEQVTARLEEAKRNKMTKGKATDSTESKGDMVMAKSNVSSDTHAIQSKPEAQKADKPPVSQPQKVETKVVTEKMDYKDLAKLRGAKEDMVKQVLMVFVFLFIGVIVVAFTGVGMETLLIVAAVGLLLYGGIAAMIFLPDYLKLEKDLSNREKIRIKVRVKDIAVESGTTYLMLQPNKYRVNKVTATNKSYSTNLLNKELEIYVSKSSHTLLDIVNVSY